MELNPKEYGQKIDKSEETVQGIICIKVKNKFLGIYIMPWYN